MHRTLLLLLVATVLGGGVSEALAQQIERSRTVSQSNLISDHSQPAALDRVRPLHITDRLIRRPEGQAALKEYQRKKRLGLLPAAKTRDPGIALITTRTFQVRNFKEDREETVEFTLGVEEDRFNLWVETSQLSSSGGDITEQDLESMRVALAEQTSSRSFRPDSGIVAIDEMVFGSPPNVDGDHVTDILIHDIKDFFDPSNGQFSAVLGFFDPDDLSSPNSSDIIHIDTVPGMYTIDGMKKPFSGVQQTLAHEYQHLIFAESNSGLGSTFVDEGLAEWAETVNGFTARSITYLDSKSERGRPFFDFRGAGGDVEAFGGPNGEDYQRAGLFTNYISERIGVFETGAISQTSSSAAFGYYNAALEPALALNEVLVNFHIANLINDPSAAPDYGHQKSQYQFVTASSIETIDGLSQEQYAEGNTELETGAVRYVRFENVADLSFSGDAVSGTTSDRERLRFILVGISTNGVTTVTESDPGGEPIVANGEYDSITVVAVHDGVTDTTPVSFRLEADWNPAMSGTEFEEVSAETGAVTVTDNQLEGFPFWNPPGQTLSVNDRASNRFSIPPNAVLSSIDVALLYRSNFQNQSPSSTVRDFTVKVWSSDQNDLPSNELISLDVVDSSAPFSSDQTEYVFQTVDLSSFQQDLKGMSGSLHVSVENSGSDDNYILVPHAPITTASSPSYLFTEFSNGAGWGSFQTITDGDGNTFLADLANTIRATFLLNAGATDTETDSTLPQAVSLEQNYPNPFNPSTTITFSLPQPRDVRLQVFDMLGRTVTTLLDGSMPAGSHEVRFNAGTLPSGLYLYRLDTVTSQLTRTMTLVQ